MLLLTDKLSGFFQLFFPVFAAFHVIFAAGKLADNRYGIIKLHGYKGGFSVCPQAQTVVPVRMKPCRCAVRPKVAERKLKRPG